MSKTNSEANLELEVYRLLTKTFILLDDCDRHFFAEYGLSARQFWALTYLDEVKGCSMVDLSRMLLTDKSNITGIIDRLERLKLVKRTPDTNDRRIILLTLTPEGRLLRDSVNEQHESRILDVMSGVSGDKLSSLIENLTTISRSLEEYLEQVNTAPVA